MKMSGRYWRNHFGSGGFDAHPVTKLKRSGFSDTEQIAVAVKQRQALLTHNIHFDFGDTRALGAIRFPTCMNNLLIANSRGAFPTYSLQPAQPALSTTKDPA